MKDFWKRKYKESVDLHMLDPGATIALCNAEASVFKRNKLIHPTFQKQKQRTHPQ
jgi:hypothetical protein